MGSADRPLVRRDVRTRLPRGWCRQTSSKKGAKGGQTLSKSARKRRNKAARNARAQAAQASVLEAPLDVESSLGDPDAVSWGDSDAVSVGRS